MPCENERSRRDAQIADVMYGASMRGPEKAAPFKTIEGESMTAHEQRLADTLHPPEDRRFPDPVGKDAAPGKVKDVVRDRDGDILTQSWYGGEVGSNEKLAAAHGLLSNADVSKMDFVAAGASTAHCDLRNADARGTRFLDLGHSRLEGLIVDETTDISNCNFFGADVGPDLYQKLRGCKGFDKALNLNKPRVK